MENQYYLKKTQIIKLYTENMELYYLKYVQERFEPIIY